MTLNFLHLSRDKAANIRGYEVNFLNDGDTTLTLISVLVQVFELLVLPKSSDNLDVCFGNVFGWIESNGISNCVSIICEFLEIFLYAHFRFRFGNETTLIIREHGDLKYWPIPQPIVVMQDFGTLIVLFSKELMSNLLDMAVSYQSIFRMQAIFNDMAQTVMVPTPGTCPPHPSSESQLFKQIPIPAYEYAKQYKEQNKYTHEEDDDNEEKGKVGKVFNRIKLTTKVSNEPALTFATNNNDGGTEKEENLNEFLRAYKLQIAHRNKIEMFDELPRNQNKKHPTLEVKKRKCNYIINNSLPFYQTTKNVQFPNTSNIFREPLAIDIVKDYTHIESTFSCEANKSLINIYDHAPEKFLETPNVDQLVPMIGSPQHISTEQPSEFHSLGLVYTQNRNAYQIFHTLVLTAEQAFVTMNLKKMVHSKVTDQAQEDFNLKTRSTPVAGTTKLKTPTPTSSSKEKPSTKEALDSCMPDIHINIELGQGSSTERGSIKLQYGGSAGRIVITNDRKRKKGMASVI